MKFCFYIELQDEVGSALKIKLILLSYIFSQLNGDAGWEYEDIVLERVSYLKINDDLF